jgi:membrane-bound lytic murein transglycosylase D
MMRMMRKLFLVSATVLIAIGLASYAPDARAAKRLEDSSGLIRYPELESNVKFWSDVFGKYTRRQVAFHDPYHMDLIWSVGDIGGIVDRTARDSAAQSRAIRDYINSESKRLGRLIEKVERSTPKTSEEKRIAALLGSAGPDAPSAAVLAGRIRGQRGLGDQLCESMGRARPFLPEMRRLLAKHGVPEELAALPLVESGYNVGAHSHANAVGMWQFTRGTGRRFLHIDHVVDERRDPLLASEAAAKYLRENYDRLGSWPLAITAYNHGANGIAYAVRKLQTKNLATIVSKYRSRYFGFASRNFYSEFLAAHDTMARGLVECEATGADYVATAEFVLDAYVPIKDLAAAAAISPDDLMAMNPALAADVGKGRLRVPKGYRLHIPAKSKSRFTATYANLPADSRYRAQASYYASHRVRRGETLSEIAKSYRTTVAALQYHNSIRDPRHLRYGVMLKVPVSGGQQVAAAPRPSSHRITRGETLSHVAKRYGVSLAAMQRYNNIQNANKLFTGQVVKIPSGGARQYRTHQVARGQTLSHIAKLYQTSVRALQNDNGILDPRTLRQGQVLKVPM